MAALMVFSCASGDLEQPKRLASALRNKQRMLEARLTGMQQPEQQIQAGFEKFGDMAPPKHRILQKIMDQSVQGRTAIVAEVSRVSPAETPDSLARRSQHYVEWGADAISVCTDEEISPDGVADLEAVCKAVDVPVIRKDWIIHPIQILDTREAGASALTTVYSILSKGTPAILRYVVTAGLDAIVEIVNQKELEELTPLGVPLFGFNISVGISVPIPGFRQDIARSLVQNLPFGAASIVGVSTNQEARQLKLAGADAVYLRREIFKELASAEEQQKFFEALKSDLSGDD